MGKIIRRPVGWETDEEWQLELKAFHWNPSWNPDETQDLVHELWFQYVHVASILEDIRVKIEDNSLTLENLNDIVNPVSEEPGEK